MTTLNKETQSDIEELLPWHAAGTLSHRDAQRVEAALAGDPELARRYDLVREEFGQTIHLNEALGAPSARAMESLFAKIAAEPTRRRATHFNFSTWVAELLVSLSPRTLALSASIAVVAILLQAGLIAGIVINERTAGYETASAPSTAPGVGAFALIRFAPQATVDDINRFLETNKLAIVAGPATGGLYKVRISEAALPKDDVARVVKQLQQNKAVGFVATTE
jgi:anti-sigma factor RsiW